MKLMNIFDAIFPERDDHRLVRTSAPETFVHYYSPTHTDTFVSLSHFHEPAIRASLHELKFHHNKRAAVLLALLLKKFLAIQPPSIIIPIPLSSQRQRERKHNQVSTLVTYTLPSVPLHTLNENMLKRTRHTVPQTSLTKSERQQNIQGAFTAVATSTTLPDLPIILLDDVATTGATLQAARAALLEHTKTPITCVAIAH